MVEFQGQAVASILTIVMTRFALTMEHALMVSMSTHVNVQTIGWDPTALL